MKRFHQKWFLLTMLLVSFLNTSAQVVVNLQLPPSGILQKSQLWNLVVVNGSGEDLSLQIEMNVFDSRTGDRVFSAISGSVTVKAGAKQLRMNDLMPVQYQNINSLYYFDAGMNGLLPVGVFKVCYHFFKQSTKGREPILEECSEIEIAPMSPPLLMMPSDSAVIKNRYPQFTWAPPTPVQTFKGLNYELRVVEMQVGQNSAEAIQNNLPFAEKGGIRETYYSYPSSLPQFDTSAHYAWQVTAFDAAGYAAKSEIWIFSLEKNSETKPRATNSYVRLEQSQNPSLFISNGKVKFAYDNVVGDAMVNYKLIQLSGNGQQVMNEGRLQVSNGQNYLEVNLEGKRFWRENELYRFELMNSNGQKWFLNIKFINKEQQR